MAMYASSSSIMAKIIEKEKEKKELEKCKLKVVKLDDEITCMQEKFSKAGELIMESGDIGSKPFDNGKTKATAVEIKKISDNLQLSIEDIELKIAELEDTISDLYKQYDLALKTEQQQAARAKNKKSINNAKGGAIKQIYLKE